MPRTPEQVAATDEFANDIKYEVPPSHLEPQGLMFEDDTWSDLVDWIRGSGHTRFSDHLKVYIARRWDQPMDEVYIRIDGFVAKELDRIDRLENPEDFGGGFDGNYN